MPCGLAIDEAAGFEFREGGCKSSENGAGSQERFDLPLGGFLANILLSMMRATLPRPDIYLHVSHTCTYQHARARIPARIFRMLARARAQTLRARGWAVARVSNERAAERQGAASERSGIREPDPAGIGSGTAEIALRRTRAASFSAEFPQTQNTSGAELPGCPPYIFPRSFPHLDLKSLTGGWDQK